MIALIAEKPSVAKDIARIIGATQRNDGYLSGNGYMVTWAFGHLIQLAMPEAYGVANFRRESLPIIPTDFWLIPRQAKAEKGYKADPGVLKQLKVIKEVFDQCDRIIVATDAGREGELIFRYIFHYLDCRKPFVRLWISSLTDRAIREGMENLQPGERYDNLYLAAKSRSEADWLIGINATQALSVAAGQGVFSLGRVQTPTLVMICDRYLENKNFVPTKFWQLKASTASGEIGFTVQSTDKWEQQPDAIAALQRAKDAGQLEVKSVERKEASQEPPLLYDLTTLQKEANTKLNFSADKTLSIAQSLYEKKVMSYPRTGSRYISEDVFEEMPERIALLERYPRFAGYAAGLDSATLNRRSVNDGKVTDHHALIITENLPGELSKDERAIYEMVAGRMLEAFSGKCVKDVTTVLLSAGDTDFAVKGAVMKTAGWRAVFSEQDTEDEDTAALPPLQEGQTLPLSGVDLLEKQTKPKPLHTESSLLAAMENAGKELEDAELKASMKDAGIGTPATRAAIIETLFARQYIVREKKNLVPTDKGLAVYRIVKDKKIADVEMTGMWEIALAKIEAGGMDADTFRKGIEVYAAQITAELLSVQLSFASGETCPCPKCGSGRILFYPKVAKCSNVDCTLTIFRSKCDKQLTDKQIVELVTKRKTGLIKGFKGKNGKTFDASLVLDEQFNVAFSFPEKKGKPKK
ncbi:type IA DNA topoisomerase [Bacteroides clarus]|uniref:DNA topoisomerase n=1 Tax=Bacteroides clarus TaxID=626929 RepID=A0A412Y741_9BACE|nr:type IA DNA topoisomerase [Bacteroides clarus]RGV36065.1 type IA DNA topoisomerase [Bacteroides clarus]RGV53249.1 type IA DNA topoisomerase [Bacteroides clarus]